MPVPARRVLVTRPQPQADEWVARLAALGVPAQALPLLAIDGPPDILAVHHAWRALPGQQGVMFVSPNAVQRFFEHRPDAAGAQAPVARPADALAAWPAGALAACPGPGTAQALRDAGVPADLIVSPPADSPRFDSEALWPLLQARRDWRGAGLLVVRGEGGRDWLAERLREAGAAVHFVQAYRRHAPRLTAEARGWLQAALHDPAAWLWAFSSSEAVQHLPMLAPGADWSRSQALATHPRIAQAARAIGFGQVGEVPPTPVALRDWLTNEMSDAKPSLPR